MKQSARDPIVTPRRLSKAKHSGPRGADGVARLARFIGAKPGTESNSLELFVAVEKHARRAPPPFCPECGRGVSDTCQNCGWGPKKKLDRPVASNHS